MVKGQYPNGTKPFKLDEAKVEYNQPLKMCADAPFNFQVVLPVGFTKRQALKKIYDETTIMQKRIQEEALDELATIKAMALEEEAFKAEVREVIDVDLKEAADKPVPPGINYALLPLVKLLNKAKHDEYADALYQKTIYSVVDKMMVTRRSTRLHRSLWYSLTLRRS